MKKIIMAVAAVAMAASMFAVDFSAHVEVDGDFAYGHINGYENTWTAPYDKAKSDIQFFGIENNNQKDADLLIVDFQGDKGGAHFQFWGTNNGPLQMRAIKTWFKPIDWLTVTAGSVGLYVYKERINWWKVPTAGYHGGAWSRKTGTYSSASLYEDAGIMIEANLPVMNGLYLGAGVAPGYELPWLSMSDGNSTTAPYGLMAKLQITDAISAEVSWRDDGKDFEKYLTAGVEFGNWGTPYYGFVQGILNINNWNESYNDWAEDKYGMCLRGIAIDNYFSYNFGFMKVEVTAPITIRGLVKYDTDAEKEDDYSYMTLRAKVSVPLDKFTFSCIVGSDEGFAEPPAKSGEAVRWRLNKEFGDFFNIYVNPAISLNVGLCALSVGAELAVDFARVEPWGANKVCSNVAWAIPFTTSISF